MARSTDQPRRVAGVMTGTSADAIDVVVAEFRGAMPRVAASVLHHAQAPLPPAIRDLARRLPEGAATVTELAALEHGLSAAIVDLARAAYAAAPFELIGVHGQTVWHRPPPAEPALTWQVFDPYPLAQALDVPVAFDFRRADVAAGGHGAPLAPLAHGVLFGGALGDGGAVLNLGGIANVTVVPPGAALDGLRAWDTGPGMMLLDALASELLGRPYDAEGRAALGGTAHEPTLKALLHNPYFATAPPKSAGRETFGRRFLAEFARHADAAELSPADRLRTAAALTAAAVAHDLAAVPPGLLIVAGGGARHGAVRTELAARLPNWTIAPSDDFGIGLDQLEALAFALLADLRRDGVPGNLAHVTGARRAVVLGALAVP